jgi:hypothetical protein
MTNKVLVVTPPDDVLLDGVRILVVDLDNAQTQIVSDSLKTITHEHEVILYFWHTGDDVNWLLDKKHKSSLVIFNADSTNDIIVGYLAAQSNSAYFGQLKNIEKVNNSAIYSMEHCSDILAEHINQYETK